MAKVLRDKNGRFMKQPKASQVDLNIVLLILLAIFVGIMILSQT